MKYDPPVYCGLYNTSVVEANCGNVNREILYVTCKHVSIRLTLMILKCQGDNVERKW